MERTFERCVEGKVDASIVHENGEALKRVWEYLDSIEVPTTLPLFEKKDTYISRIDFETLSKVVGIFSGEYHVNIFLTPFIDTNWKQPQVGIGSHIRPYKFYLEQPTLFLPASFYRDPEWKEASVYLKNKLKDQVQGVAKVLGKTVHEDWEQDIDDVIAFEREIALKINLPEQDRKDYSK